MIYVVDCKGCKEGAIYNLEFLKHTSSNGTCNNLLGRQLGRCELNNVEGVLIGRFICRD